MTWGETLMPYNTVQNGNEKSPIGNTSTELDREDMLFANAFEKCLTDLANEVYGIHEPLDISQRVL